MCDNSALNMLRMPRIASKLTCLKAESEICTWNGNTTVVWTQLCILQDISFTTTAWRALQYINDEFVPATRQRMSNTFLRSIKVKTLQRSALCGINCAAMLNIESKAVM